MGREDRTLDRLPACLSVGGRSPVGTMVRKFPVGKFPCDSRRTHYILAMSIAELRKLSRDEKLKIIETLWGDLARDEESFKSPAWHAEELRKTETDLAAGRVEVLDWEAAKKELRERFE
jgi:putative addiction module component (TIGR02574 family)